MLIKLLQQSALVSLLLNLRRKVITSQVWKVPSWHIAHTVSCVICNFLITPWSCTRVRGEEIMGMQKWEIKVYGISGAERLRQGARSSPDKQTFELGRFVWVTSSLQCPGVGYCNLLLKLLSLSLDWVELRVLLWGKTYQTLALASQVLLSSIEETRQEVGGRKETELLLMVDPSRTELVRVELASSQTGLGG